MNDSNFMRYSRQIMLKDIDFLGQQKLLISRVLIIGLGGLGSPAVLYLAGAGIGTLVLADNDTVHLSNLHRQILFTTEDISKSKVQVTQHRLQSLNPEIQIIPLQEKLIGESLQFQIEKADVVLDCTDNMETKQAINIACVETNTPLITASATGFFGLIMVFTPPWLQGCYHCLFPENNEIHYTCRTEGIMGPVVGIMGTLQALEAITLLSGVKTKRNQLRIFDARLGKWHQITLQKSTNCIVCRERNANSIK